MLTLKLLFCHFLWRLKHCVGQKKFLVISGLGVIIVAMSSHCWINDPDELFRRLCLSQQADKMKVSFAKATYWLFFRSFEFWLWSAMAENNRHFVLSLTSMTLVLALLSYDVSCYIKHLPLTQSYIKGNRLEFGAWEITSSCYAGITWGAWQ